MVLLRSHKAGGTPHPPHRVKKRRPVVGVHIAEKGAAGLLLIHYAAIVKVHRYIASLRHMAVERQHSLKNRQLLFHGEGQKGRSGGILLSHAQGICPGEQKRIPSGHGPIPQQGQQCRVGQVPNDLGGFFQEADSLAGLAIKAEGPCPGIFQKVPPPLPLQAEAQVSGILAVEYTEDPSPPVEERKVGLFFHHTGNPIGKQCDNHKSPLMNRQR